MISRYSVCMFVSLFWLLSSARATLCAEVTQANAIKLWFERNKIDSPEIQHYSGTFWMGRINGKSIALVNGKLELHGAVPPDGFTEDLTAPELFRTTFRKIGTSPVYSSLTPLTKDLGQGDFLRPISQNLFLAEPGHQWNVAIDKDSMFCAWEAKTPAKFGLRFTSRVQANQILREVRFVPLPVIEKVDQWIDVDSDAIDLKSSKALQINSDDSTRKESILAWSGSKRWLWLPNIVDKFNEAFRSTEKGDDKVNLESVKDEAFLRIRDRAISVKDYNIRQFQATDSFSIGYYRNTNQELQSFTFAMRNSYQAHWFANKNDPGNTSTRLPGMSEVRFWSNTANAFLKNVDGGLDGLNGIYWPRIIEDDVGTTLGQGGRVLRQPNSEGQSVVYLHETEVTIKQWLVAIGAKLGNRAELFKEGDRNPLETPQNPQTEAKKVWERLRQTWDSYNPPTGEAFAWWQVESHLAKESFPILVNSEEKERYLPITAHVKRLQRNTFADYVVGRTFAWMDELNWNQGNNLTNEVGSFTTAAISALETNQHPRYFDKSEHSQFMVALNNYIASRNAHVKTNDSLLVAPSAEPVCFVKPFHPVLLGASNGPGNTPWQEFAAHIDIKHYDGESLSKNAIIRLPRPTELEAILKAERTNVTTRNWPSTKANGLRSFPTVSEWTYDGAGSLARFTIKGVNRRSDHLELSEEFRKGIQFAPLGAAGVPDYVSPVVGLRWAIEINPLQNFTLPLPDVAPSDRDLPADLNALTARLDDAISQLFGKGADSIPNSDQVRTAIRTSYGPHPYWKLEYLRHILFAGHWGKSSDSLLVPYDNLTEARLMQVINTYLPSSN